MCEGDGVCVRVVGMCEGGSVGIYVNVEVGKEKKGSTPHEHMGCSKDSIQLHVTGRILNVHSLICGVEQGDVPDGKNALIELHQLGQNLVIEGKRKGTEGGGEREEERGREEERERRREGERQREEERERRRRTEGGG